MKFNVRYGDGFKRSCPGIPCFLKKIRPKKIVEILLEKMCRVVPQAEINRLDQHTFNVNRNEECTVIRKGYEVFLENESKFCSCGCHDFRRYRMLCKHFFTIFDSNLAKFDDLSPLFLNHPYMILDQSMFGNNNDIGSPSRKNEIPCNNMVEEDDKLNNEFSENTETIYTNHRDDLNMKSSVIKRKKIDIRSNWKQLIDLSFTTNEEHVIIELDQDVNYLLTKFRNIICTNCINLLPKEETKKRKKVVKECDTTINCERPPLKKRKHPFSRRVGSVADMMVQFYRAKIALADESEEKKELTNIEIDGDDQLCEGCYSYSVFCVCSVMPSL